MLRGIRAHDYVLLELAFHFDDGGRAHFILVLTVRLLQYQQVSGPLHISPGLGLHQLPVCVRQGAHALLATTLELKVGEHCL